MAQTPDNVAVAQRSARSADLMATVPAAAIRPASGPACTRTKFTALGMGAAAGALLIVYGFI